MPQNLQNVVIKQNEAMLDLNLNDLQEVFGDIDLKVEEKIKQQKENMEIYEYLDQSEPVAEEEEVLPEWEEVQPAESKALEQSEPSKVNEQYIF